MRRLAELAAEKLTASEIAQALTSEFSRFFSRSAVMGKCFRGRIALQSGSAGLVRRKDPKQPPSPPGAAADGGRKDVKPLPTVEPIPAVEPAPSAVECLSGEDDLPEDADPVDHEPYDPLNFVVALDGLFGPTRFIEARSDQCKWFTTKSNAYGARVCGEHNVVGTSYCRKHAKRVYTAAVNAGRSRNELERTQRNRTTKLIGRSTGR